MQLAMRQHAVLRDIVPDFDSRFRTQWHRQWIGTDGETRYRIRQRPHGAEAVRFAERVVLEMQWGGPDGTRRHPAYVTEQTPEGLMAAGWFIFFAAAVAIVILGMLIAWFVS